MLLISQKNICNFFFKIFLDFIYIFVGLICLDILLFSFDKLELLDLILLIN